MISKFSAIILALAVFPTLLFADVVTKGTVLKVDRAKNELVVKTDRGQETLILSSDTKGVANAKEGAKVIIKFTEKDGQAKVIQILPQERGTKKTKL